MQLEILSKEIIKPSSPTPLELRYHTLCFFDQVGASCYIKTVYFYSCCSRVDSGDRTEILKRSLSITLAQYYPFAGRLRDDVSVVDCNDEGITFLEARIRCEMSEMMNIFKKSARIPTKLLFSDDLQGKDHRFNPLLSLQLTHFDCGGTAISVFLFHKVADAATLINFMNHWADVNSVSPLFTGAEIFGPVAHRLPAQISAPMTKQENVVSKRFRFSGSKIVALKAIVSEKVKDPTRVEVIMALIYKAAVSASSLILKQLPETTLLQTINLRKRMAPPLPETLAGNIVSCFIASSTRPEAIEMELSSTVAAMKQSLAQFCDKYMRKHPVEGWGSVYKLHEEVAKELLKPNQTVYACSSWCRFPFYEADFGWGKPTWIALPVFLQKNVIILIDTEDGEGIEAWISFESKQMAAFEQNQELLAYLETPPP